MLLSSSHCWCYCIIEFSCCKLSKAEILQNMVILFVQNTPLQALGAFPEYPRIAPNEQGSSSEASQYLQRQCSIQEARQNGLPC